MEIRIKTADEFRDAHVVIEIRAEEDEDIRVRPLVDERLYDPDKAVEVMTENYQRARNRIAELKEEIQRMDAQISGQTEWAGQLDQRNAQLTAELARERDRNAELVEQLARVDKGHVCVADGYPSELDWAAVRAERDEARERAARRERKIEELTAALAERADRIAELEEEIQRMDDQISAQTEQADKLNERNAELVGELARQRNYAADNREWAERAESRLAEYAADLSVAKRKLDKAQHMIETLSDQLGRISGAVHGRELIQAVSVARSWDRKEPRAMAEAIRQVRDALGSPSLPEAASEPTSQA